MSVPQLPTPVDLASRLTLMVASHAKCTGAWVQHRGPLTIEEFISIQQSITNYFRSVVEEHFEVAKS